MLGYAGKHNEALAPRHRFAHRLLFSLLIGFILYSFVLSIGMAGYHYFESLPWIDSYVNAAMILSGMGPLDQPKTDIGKLFAGTYALF